MNGQRRRFARFCVAGALGFVVDGAVLELVRLGLGWGNLAARVPSFVCAVLATWLLNRRLAFAGLPAAKAPRELLRYFLVSLAGNLVNLAVYAVLAVTLFVQQPLLALAAASIAGMLFNYLGYSRWVFGPGAALPSASDEAGAKPSNGIS